MAIGADLNVIQAFGEKLKNANSNLADTLYTQGDEYLKELGKVLLSPNDFKPICDYTCDIINNTIKRYYLRCLGQGDSLYRIGAAYAEKGGITQRNPIKFDEPAYLKPDGYIEENKELCETLGVIKLEEEGYSTLQTNFRNSVIPLLIGAVEASSAVLRDVESSGVMGRKTEMAQDLSITDLEIQSKKDIEQIPDMTDKAAQKVKESFEESDIIASRAFSSMGEDSESIPDKVE